MRIEIGDIWGFHRHMWALIPTNIGWKADGANVMGRGLARQAAGKFPELPAWYGSKCKEFGAETPVIAAPWHRLILFPVKALNEKEPWLSWKRDASLELIRRSAKQLAELKTVTDQIALPLVGCGNGNQNPLEVLPILEEHLKEQRFVLVLQSRELLAAVRK